jgi:alpha/beta superfamily hydrolase
MFTRPYDVIHEEPLQLSGTSRLHAMLYAPADRDAGCTVVLVGPDGEERAWAQRALVTTARALAQQGCSVLRFDFAGQGESDGDYEHTTVQTRVADLIAACRTIQERTERRPVVLGVRLGGAIAVAAAATSPQLRELVLWEPISAPAEYVRQLLRVNLSMQMVAHGRVLRDRDELMAAARSGELVSVNGYNLSGTFIDELLGFDFSRVLAALPTRTLILSTGPMNPEIADLPRVEVERIGCPPFWIEPKVHLTAPPTFLARTLAWLLASASTGRAT